MEKSYLESQTLTVGRRRKLGKKLGLSEAQVQKWYMQRRETDLGNNQTSNTTPVENTATTTTSRRRSTLRTMSDEANEVSNPVSVAAKEESLADTTTAVVENVPVATTTAESTTPGDVGVVKKNKRGRPPKKRPIEDEAKSETGDVNGAGESIVNGINGNHEKETVDKENSNGVDEDTNHKGKIS